ncbi:unnamed protein product [Chironomus riparius]|uniref:BZIP domain-containing protein n=1 Tax=Chironomus riparius TaxID=315576 RepID=A0A9N9RJV6_9DIPT|nr:unnamed protein product [Chironomus riparius]
MAERQKSKSSTDPKYLARREKNRLAVTKFRLKKALEDEQKQSRQDKLRLDNAKLEGKVHQLKVTKQLLKELLVEQLRQRGKRLTKEQMECINDNFDDDFDIKEEDDAECDDKSTSGELSDQSSSDFDYRG